MDNSRKCFNIWSGELKNTLKMTKKDLGNRNGQNKKKYCGYIDHSTLGMIIYKWK